MIKGVPRQSGTTPRVCWAISDVELAGPGSWIRVKVATLIGATHDHEDIVMTCDIASMRRNLILGGE